MPVSADTLRVLMSAGLGGDDLLRVVESIDRDMELCAQPAPQRSAAAIRQARYRERQTTQTVTGDVTRDVTTDKESAPTPPERTLKNPPSGVKKRKQAFPIGWHLEDPDTAYAAELSFSDRQIASMFESFRDHHVGKGTVMADWPAAWRTWVRNEIKFGRTKPAGATPKASTTGGWPLTWDRETCRKVFLAGSWPPGIGCPPPGEPGCRVPEAIQREWLSERSATARNVA